MGSEEGHMPGGLSGVVCGVLAGQKRKGSTEDTCVSSGPIPGAHSRMPCDDGTDDPQLVMSSQARYPCMLSCIPASVPVHTFLQTMVAENGGAPTWSSGGTGGICNLAFELGSPMQSRQGHKI